MEITNIAGSLWEEFKMSYFAEPLIEEHSCVLQEVASLIEVSKDFNQTEVHIRPPE